MNNSLILSTWSTLALVTSLCWRQRPPLRVTGGSSDEGFSLTHWLGQQLLRYRINRSPPAFLSVSASLSFPTAWACSPQSPILPNGSELETNVCGGARKWHLWQMELSIRRDGCRLLVSGRRLSPCADVWSRFTPSSTFCHSGVLFLSFFVCFLSTAPKDKVKRVDSVETEAGEIRRLHQGGG